MKNLVTISVCFGIVSLSQCQWLEKSTVQANFNIPFSPVEGSGLPPEVQTLEGELLYPTFRNAPNSFTLEIGWGTVASISSSDGLSFPYVWQGGSRLIRQKDNSGSGNWLGTFAPGTDVLTSPSAENTVCFSVWGPPSGEIAVRGYGVLVQPVSRESNVVAQVRGWNSTTRSWSNWLEYGIKRPERSQYKPFFIGVQTVSGIILGSLQIRIVEADNPMPIKFGMTVPQLRMQ